MIHAMLNQRVAIKISTNIRDKNKLNPHLSRR
ncbi:MAG: hypothetical protein MRERV_1c060 [Mycoplasmataceae bacterium RV_VA103A]|nr:MAG: hypothetical protein MRERV_1c060 [Mycoplasmataceae bacterium RV_VA103A]